MEKLTNIKNYHRGMGILIILIQLLFQISNSIYFLGLILIFMFLYESKIIKNLNHQKGEPNKIRAVLKQYKWLNLCALIPIFFVSLNLIADASQKSNLSEVIFTNPILWINFLIIGGIMMHLSMTMEIKKIEKEIVR